MSESTEQTSQEQFSFIETERLLQKRWSEREIFKKSLEQTKSKAPYIFYDGPPFATGLPHHGHIVASTLKDVVPRYFTMKGFYVDRRFGWDCHGLPIEQEIDKKFGMSASDYVAQNGVAAYNKECRGIVDRYVVEWERTIGRLGRWVDFKNDYKTMDPEFMESVWWVFKSIWDKGLIYQGNKIVPYSPALQTALSNFEATQNYQDIQDPAVTILFKSLKDPKTFFMAWTTTPWTLPSNLGLCVHPEVTYVKFHDTENDRFLILAEARVEAYQKQLKGEVVETFPGATLKGQKYEPLFPFFSSMAKDGYFTMFNDEYVTTTDGTGIVHQAPAHGEDDMRVMKAAGLREVVSPLDAAGKFTAEAAPFKGLAFKEADKEIIKALKEKGLLFLQSTLVHSYPMCYRTDTPLMYRAMPQWYLAVEKIKDKMLKANEQITWVPAHIKEGRFGKWLENARDWAISRNRYWGTPLPIWINDVTEKAVCVGSIKELMDLTGKNVTDLHREFVDDLTFTKPGEAGVYRRIPEVLDCWFESGSMPYAQLHYPFENKEVFEKGFPAEFIAEGLDQTRGWFYTLTVLSAALFDKPAFKNVIVNGMVLAKDGRKMSKRLRNYTPPDELLESHGADALRLYLINSGLVRAEELRFTDDGVKEMTRRVLLPWYNSFKFFDTYSKADGWTADSHTQSSDNILDQWILSKLQTLIVEVNKEMQAYRLYNVVAPLFSFIDDLTNWYIRLNRRRFWEEGLEKDKKAAYTTLHRVLSDVSRLMAPFAPFLADYTFMALTGKESVHLDSYPDADNKLMNPTLETAVDRMQQVILLGRQKRLQENVKVKTPLHLLEIIHQDQNLLLEIKKLEEYLVGELNVKAVGYKSNEADYIRLYAKANLPVLGKKLGKEMGKFRGKIEALDYATLQKVEAGEHTVIEGIDFSPEEILVYREAKSGTQAVTNRFITINMDCTLDQELIDEGLAREIVNRIQQSRKSARLNVSDRVNVTIVFDGPESDQLKSVISKHQKHIAHETLASQIAVSETGKSLIEALPVLETKCSIGLSVI
ncbi:MAG: isoleucine--tRNA ligase [Bacteriovoracaceae bacterium]|nr:isoleucine--tRNA ligase [Bacteriovoracaceae bacterium]